MWRLLILFLAMVIALIAGRVATAQKTAFTADGARVYLFSNGTWSTDPEGVGPAPACWSWHCGRRGSPWTRPTAAR